MRRDLLVIVLLGLVLVLAGLGVTKALFDPAYEPIVLQSDDPCEEGCLAPAPVAPPGHPSHAETASLPRAGR